MITHRMNLIDDLILNGNTTETEVTVPTYLVGTGGIGADIVRRCKRALSQSTNASLVCMDIFDTDDAVMAGTGHLPGFSEGEFCHLASEPIRRVFRSPDKHPTIADRLELDDDDTLVTLQRILGAEIQQAGQVRPFGLGCCLANALQIRNRIRTARNFFQQKFAQLKESRKHDRHIEFANRIRVFIFVSACGGSGSSFVNDIVAMLRDEFGNSIPIEITLCVVTADVLESILSGSPDEFERCKANQYAFFRELESFELGFLHRQNIVLSGSEQSTLIAPTRLYNQILVAQMTDAKGHRFQDLGELCDAVAMHFSLLMTTNLGGEIERTDANGIARQGLAPDPDTGRNRNLSSFAAGSIGFDGQRLFVNSVALQLTELLGKVLGDAAPASRASEEGSSRRMKAKPSASKLWESQVNSLLADHGLDDSGDGERLMDRLTKNVTPGVDGTSKRLFRRVTAKGRQYFANADFETRLLSERQSFFETIIPQVRERIEKEQAEFQPEFNKLVKDAVAQVLGSRDLRWCRGFLAAAAQRASQLSDACRAREAERRSDEANYASQFNTGQKMLGGWLAKYRANQQVQDRLELVFRRLKQCRLEAEVASAAASILRTFSGQFENTGNVISKSAETLDAVLTDVHGHTLSFEYGYDSITTSSAAELDIASPAFYASFFVENRLDSDQIVRQVGDKLGKSRAQLIVDLASQDSVRRELVSMIAEHFQQAVNQLDIAMIIEQQLNAGPESSRRVIRIIKELIRGCQTIWCVRPPRAETVFGDTILLAIPETCSPALRDRLQTIATEVNPALVGGGHNGEIALVNLNLKNRIAVVRRTHGARPHYLDGWESCRRSYEYWQKHGTHPIHTFPKRITDKMPQLEPAEESSRTELAFALGVAFGWIAIRGNRYYRNLSTVGSNGTTKFVCRLKSHADCIPFRDDNLRLDLALKVFADEGRIQYDMRDNYDVRDFLDTGRQKAFLAFQSAEENQRLILQAFEEIRACAGDSFVAKQLEDYIDMQDECIETNGCDPKLYDQKKAELTVLRRQVESLRVNR